VLLLLWRRAIILVGTQTFQPATRSLIWEKVDQIYYGASVSDHCAMHSKLRLTGNFSLVGFARLSIIYTVPIRTSPVADHQRVHAYAGCACAELRRPVSVQESFGAEYRDSTLGIYAGRKKWFWEFNSDIAEFSLPYWSSPIVDSYFISSRSWN